MDAVRQLILAKSAELDRGLSDLSKSIKRNHAYLQQFIKRGVPHELPEKLRPALARELQVSEDELRLTGGNKFIPPNGSDPKPPQSKADYGDVGKPTYNNPPQLSSIPVERLMGEVDLPVHSIVQGGKGVLVLESDPFGYIARPRRLLGKARGYGVLVKGDSMSPEYNENDIAYVDPSLHPKMDDPCVFQGERPDGSVEAMLKYLDRSPDASATHFYVRTGPGTGKVKRQVKHFAVKKADWQRCHVVVGKESGR